MPAPRPAPPTPTAARGPRRQRVRTANPTPHPLERLFSQSVFKNAAATDWPSCRSRDPRPPTHTRSTVPPAGRAPTPPRARSLPLSPVAAVCSKPSGLSPGGAPPASRPPVTYPSTPAPCDACAARSRGGHRRRPHTAPRHLAGTPPAARGASAGPPAARRGPSAQRPPFRTFSQLLRPAVVALRERPCRGCPDPARLPRGTPRLLPPACPSACSRRPPKWSSQGSHTRPGHRHQRLTLGPGTPRAPRGREAEIATSRLRGPPGRGEGGLDCPQHSVSAQRETDPPASDAVYQNTGS